MYGFVKNDGLNSVDERGMKRHRLTYTILDANDNWFIEGLFNPGSVPISGLSAIVDEIQIKIDPYHKDGVDPCHCIERITIWTHGMMGSLHVGFGEYLSFRQELLYSAFLEKIRAGRPDLPDPRQLIPPILKEAVENERKVNRQALKHLENIKQRMCEGGEVVIYACGAGYGEGGEELMRQLIAAFAGPKRIRVSELLKWDVSSLFGIPIRVGE